jgi:hypothetical protein
MRAASQVAFAIEHPASDFGLLPLSRPADIVLVRQRWEPAFEGQSLEMLRHAHMRGSLPWFRSGSASAQLGQEAEFATTFRHHIPLQTVPAVSG